MEKQKLRISVNRMIEGEVGTHVNGSWAFMSMPMCEVLDTVHGDCDLWLNLAGILDPGSDGPLRASNHERERRTK
jgi:hypothetical protein